jgi:dTDP-4-amino-4,6-dideoxygalactose transaminase
MSGGEQKYLNEAFEQNWVAPLGPNVDGFEKELAAYCGVKHAAVLSSGSAAIHLALIMLDVQPGDIVICQDFTFGASAFPIRYMGATPVFVDSEPDTWNMDPVLLERAIEDCIRGNVAGEEGERSKAKGERQKAKGERDLGRKPKAIIPVHLYGMPYKVDEIHRIADKYDIPVIEDAAEALGSSYNGKKCGSFGKLGILSFNGNKIITTSGGGALLSNNESLIKKARFLATQARDPAPHYEHSEIGYNYRMSNILAGIGRGQLEVINNRVNRRREIFEIYKNELSPFEGITLLPEPNTSQQPAPSNQHQAPSTKRQAPSNQQPAPSNQHQAPSTQQQPSYFSNRWLTTILIDKQKTGFSPTDLRLAFEAENIESRPLWKPMHLQPIFRQYPAYLNTENDKTGYSGWLFNRGLCLPSGSNMSKRDIERILKVILTKFH